MPRIARCPKWISLSTPILKGQAETGFLTLSKQDSLLMYPPERLVGAESAMDFPFVILVEGQRRRETAALKKAFSKESVFARVSVLLLTL